jgi:rod shape-determining protein MreC
MQQIFNFVFKNSYRLLFLLLLGISLVFTVQSHSFHKSKVISSANFLSGGVYNQINSVNEYFSLKGKNEALAIENARLKAILYNQKDTTKFPELDTIKGVKKINIIVSKVIRNPYQSPENYITINSGFKQGLKTDMGVVNDLGIIGIIENVSENYATIQSILNLKSKINAKIKKSNHFGTLIWNAKNTGFVQLIEVPRLAAIRKGDTVVTGADSRIFPENIGIGTIDNIYTDNETNYYTLNIRLFNDMTNLGHVYIIKSKEKEELTKLEAITKKDE